MMTQFDNRLIAVFDAGAGYLQEHLGLTMALILREISMAALFAFAFLVYAFYSTGNIAWMAIFLPFAISGGKHVLKDYKKHKANTERNWSESMARKYMLEADLKRTVFGTQRFVIFAILGCFLAIVLLNGQSILKIDLLAVVLLFTVFTAREYVNCAHPRPPASRSRQSRTSLGFSGA